MKRDRKNFQGATYHITTRCNNGEFLLNKTIHFEKYLEVLKECKKKYGFLLHNYIPVNSHVHLSLKLEKVLDISKIMHSINRWYAGWYNKIFERTGHFWEERFYGVLVEDDLQLLTTMVYDDLNAVKAGLCKHPWEWKYSGAKYYLKGIEDPLLDPPDVYFELGKTEKERQETYARVMSLYYERVIQDIS